MTNSQAPDPHALDPNASTGSIMSYDEIIYGEKQQKINNLPLNLKALPLLIN